jgi:nucleoside-diphosphate-sugar epimerase
LLRLDRENGYCGWKKMILVTGAGGFVGSAVVRELARQGIPHRSVARNLRDGHIAIDNIDSETDWTAALDGVDVVVHLASRAHLVNEALAVSQPHFKSSVATALNLARQAAAVGVNRLVFVSSIKVNGECTPPHHPFTADDEPNPRTLYARSRLDVERGLFDIANASKMDVTMIRPPLVYGPGVKGNFAGLLGWVARGVPLPFGSVNNRRSFVYVSNLADLIILTTIHPSAAGQVFLVSDDHDMSTTELLREAARALGRRPRMLPVPEHFLTLAGAALGRRDLTNRLTDSLQIDVAKTRELLGWTPRKSVAEGLSETAQWFQNADRVLDAAVRSA